MLKAGGESVLGVMMAVWSLAIWPFILRFSATVGTDCLLTGFITIKTIGVATKFDWKLIRTENGPDIVLRLSSKKSTRARDMDISSRVGEKASKALKVSPVLKKNLIRYLMQTKFSAEIRLGLSDAAATALACATIKALLGCFPKAKGSVTPDFQKETFSAELRCISAFRLGKLFLSAVLFLYAVMQQAMRQKTGGAING